MSAATATVVGYADLIDAADEVATHLGDYPSVNRLREVLSALEGTTE